MLEQKQKLDLQEKISKAIDYWEFSLALDLYEFAYKNEYLRYEYFVFLYRSGEFEKLFELIKDKIKPTWYDNKGELGDFKELKDKLKVAINEENLSLKSKIFGMGGGI